MVMNLGELLRTRNLPRKFWKVTLFNKPQESTKGAKIHLRLSCLLVAALLQVS